MCAAMWQLWGTGVKAAHGFDLRFLLTLPNLNGGLPIGIASSCCSWSSPAFLPAGMVKATSVASQELVEDLPLQSEVEVLGVVVEVLKLSTEVTRDTDKGDPMPMLPMLSTRTADIDCSLIRFSLASCLSLSSVASSNGLSTSMLRRMLSSLAASVPMI
jgi:hypothetical protein